MTFVIILFIKISVIYLVSQHFSCKCAIVYINFSIHMISKLNINAVIAFFTLVFISGCSDTSQNTQGPVIPATFTVPQGFQAPVYNFAENPYTPDGFILGRTLFYETALSKDNTLSCGLCHQQIAGFANLGHDLSHGVDNKLGNRNTPALSNLAWQPHFMWDGGVHTLDDFSLAPIQNPVEMDEKMPNVLAKLQAMPKYRELFKKAFGTEEITTQRLLKALSQFMVQLISNNSKFDKVQRGQDTFTAEEQKGYTLFNQKCAGCHAGIQFTDFSFRNNGLEPVRKTDKGRASITLNDNDLYKFKVPSLRNVELSGPYMHDGRIGSLSAVLDFYSQSVQKSATLDTLLLKDSAKPGISLSAEEKSALLAFLKTLTDMDFIKNPIFSEQ
jgi:cytochrome c peroxidase